MGVGKPSTLFLDLHPGESVTFAGAGEGPVQIEALPKSGQITRLRVTAPRSVAVRKGGGKPPPMRDNLPSAPK